MTDVKTILGVPVAQVKSVSNIPITDVKTILGSNANRPIIFTLTPIGAGTEVATLSLLTSKDITISVDGNARFYDDSGGTTNAGTTRTVESGALRTYYLKCPSGTSTLLISDAKSVVGFGSNIYNGWISSANAVSISGDVAGLTSLTYLHVTGSNTLSGDIAGLTKLTFLAVTGYNTLSGNIAGLTKLTFLAVTGYNTLSGDVAGLTNLTYFAVIGSNTLSGNIAGLTKLTYFVVQGSNTLSGDVAGLTNLTYFAVIGSNTLSGNIAGLTSLTYLHVTGSNTLSGDIAGLTKLTFLAVTGYNTLSGNIAGLTKLTFLAVTGSNTLSGDIGGSGTSAVVNGITCVRLNPCRMSDYTAGATWSLTDTSYINPSTGYGYSATEIDNILMDMAASLGTVSGKTITLKGSSAARTSASDAAVATLLSKGWTVITN